MFTAALFISTYNWPQALNVCMESIAGQSYTPTEVIICDDGSTEETEIVVEKWKARIQTEVKHVWHPDEKFQLAKIRNKGFAASKSDFCIQIDGDVFLHKDFVKDHVKFAKKGCFTTGSRVLIPETQTKKLLDGNDRKPANKKEYINFFNRLRIPLVHELFAERYKNKGRNKYFVRGCNMAFWKEDLVRVNGYNEDFVGWGSEDHELAVRLINAGVKKRFLKFGGICYHLHHPIANRDLERNNEIIMQNSINEKLIFAKKGLNQYL